MEAEKHKTRMLWLCGILHIFTHIYQVALLPLYLLIQTDLALPSIEQATLLVTVLMVSYYLPSYPMGVLSDWMYALLAGLPILSTVGLLFLRVIRKHADALAGNGKSVEPSRGPEAKGVPR